jgi:hypothetical protein
MYTNQYSVSDPNTVLISAGDTPSNDMGDSNAETVNGSCPFQSKQSKKDHTTLATLFERILGPSKRHITYQIWYSLPLMLSTHDFISSVL